MLYWFMSPYKTSSSSFFTVTDLRQDAQVGRMGKALTVILSSVLVLTFKCLSCCFNLEQPVMIPMGSCNSCITSFSPKQDGRDNNGNHPCQLYTRIFFDLAIVGP